MLVVSDTSPIINLATIGHLHLLPELFTEIVIPSAVFDEIAGEGNNEPGSVEVKTASWVRVLPVPIPTPSRFGSGRGGSHRSGTGY